MTGRKSLRQAIDCAKKTLRNAIDEVDGEYFDAMLDVRTARELGVTPLPILTDSPVA